MRWPLLWLAVTVLIFSLAPQKKNAYLLPAMPAQTLLVAATLAFVLRELQTRGTRMLLAAHALAGAVGVVVVYMLVWRTFAMNQANYAAGIAAGVGLIASVTAVRLSMANRGQTIGLLATAIAFAAVVHGICGWLRPEYENRRSPVPFVRAVNASVGEARLARVGFISEEVLFYLRRPTDSFDVVDDLPPDYNGFVLVADETLTALQSARPVSQVITKIENRRESDQTFLVRVSPAMAYGLTAR